MKKQPTQLDFEQNGRINEISKFLEDKEEFSPEDIISNPTIALKFSSNKLVINHFDREKILLSYPFADEIYVSFCKNCVTWTTPSELKIFLEHRAFIPVLASRYCDYPEEFQKIFIQYPHISAYEFSFLRSVTLLSSTNMGMCQHCAAKKKRDLKKLSHHAAQRNIIDSLFVNLSPYIDPDDILLDEFEKALKKDDQKYLNQIHDLSKSIWLARTAQAMNGRSLFSSSALPGLMERSIKTMPLTTNSDIEMIESALAQNIKIDIPVKTNLSKYFRCIEPYRSELSSIVNSLLDDANKSPETQIISLNNSLSELNEQLLKLSRNKRYLSCQALMGFTKSNKLLLSSVLIGSIFGLIPGCGAVAASLGIKMINKYGKIEMPEDAIPLISEIQHSIRPNLNKLIAKYSNVDLKAIQLFEIKKNLEKDL